MKLMPRYLIGLLMLMLATLAAQAQTVVIFTPNSLQNGKPFKQPNSIRLEK